MSPFETDITERRSIYSRITGHDGKTVVEVSRFTITFYKTVMIGMVLDAVACLVGKLLTHDRVRESHTRHRFTVTAGIKLWCSGARYFYSKLVERVKLCRQNKQNKNTVRKTRHKSSHICRTM